jgi:hypothetical protein
VGEVVNRSCSPFQNSGKMWIHVGSDKIEEFGSCSRPILQRSCASPSCRSNYGNSHLRSTLAHSEVTVWDNELQLTSAKRKHLLQRPHRTRAQKFELGDTFCIQY